MPTDDELLAEVEKLDAEATPDATWYRSVAAKSLSAAAFIARARTLLPELARRLRERNLRVEQLETALRPFASCSGNCSECRASWRKCAAHEALLALEKP